MWFLPPDDLGDKVGRVEGAGDEVEEEPGGPEDAVRELCGRES